MQSEDAGERMGEMGSVCTLFTAVLTQLSLFSLCLILGPVVHVHPRPPRSGSCPTSAGQGPKKLQAMQKAPLLLSVAGYKALLLFSTVSQFSAMPQLRAVALARRVCAHQASSQDELFSHLNPAAVGSMGTGMGPAGRLQLLRSWLQNSLHRGSDHCSHPASPVQAP